MAIVSEAPATTAAVDLRKSRKKNKQEKLMFAYGKPSQVTTTTNICCTGCGVKMLKWKMQKNTERKEIMNGAQKECKKLLFLFRKIAFMFAAVELSERSRLVQIFHSLTSFSPL